MQFRLAVALSVAVIASAGAATYALTSGASPTHDSGNSARQIQHCASAGHAADVTSTRSKSCPKGMIPIELAGPAGPSSSSPSPSPSPSHASRSRLQSPAPRTPPPSSSKAPSAAPSSAPPSSAPPISASAGSYDCGYRTDTWSSDASSVGYTVEKVSGSDGTTASFSVRLNAHPGTTEVVGYPSDQCLIYSALPGSLTSSYNVTPPASSAGLDYEFAYDIWLTSASAATSNNWNNDLELMIWTYVNGQRPAGSKVAALADGSAVWFRGTKGSNGSTVSVVLPSNATSGTADIAAIVAQLTSLGYIPSSDNGILDVEYGIEAPYGGGDVFAVNALSVTG